MDDERARGDSVHIRPIRTDDADEYVAAHRGATRRIDHRADFAIAVLDDHRGSGIGSGLLRALDAWAADQGITRQPARGDGRRRDRHR